MLEIFEVWLSFHKPSLWTYTEAQKVFRAVEREINMSITNWTISQFYEMGVSFLKGHKLAI